MSKSESKREPFKGCIIEMDTVVLNGIQLLYEITRTELSKQDVVIDEGLFARHFFGAHLETGLNRALQPSGRRSTPELAQTIRTTYLSRLAAAPIADHQPLAALVRGLSERQVRVALLTRIDHAAATAQFASLLALPNVMLISETLFAPVGGFAWDVWRRAAETMEMSGRLCTAIVASSTSAKAALAASLPVIAIPSALTDYQDYTGVYHRCDKLDDSVLPAVLQSLRI